MRITVTRADWKEALCRHLYLNEERWKQLEQEARNAAADRLIKANQKRTEELLDESRRLVGTDRRAEWLKVQDEIDRLFREHDRLSEIRFGAKRVMP